MISCPRRPGSRPSGTCKSLRWNPTPQSNLFGSSVWSAPLRFSLTTKVPRGSPIPIPTSKEKPPGVWAGTCAEIFGNSWWKTWVAWVAVRKTCRKYRRLTRFRRARKRTQAAARKWSSLSEKPLSWPEGPWPTKKNGRPIQPIFLLFLLAWFRER